MRLLSLLGMLVAAAGALPSSSTPTIGAPSLAACAPSQRLLSRGFGAPDDVALAGKRVLFTDLNRGAIATVGRGVPRVLVSSLQEPEGMVVESQTRVILAEQAVNRLIEVNLKSGRRTRIVKQLVNRTGRTGVDGIARAPGGGIYIPDSPNGRLLLLSPKGRLTTLASGMGRPVGALQFRGGVAVADETANAVWWVKSGRLHRLATVSIPDDVAALRSMLVAVTLGDARLWEVWPRVRPLIAGYGQPQGLVATGPGSVVVADSRFNALYTVTGLGGCR